MRPIMLAALVLLSTATTAAAQWCDCDIPAASVYVYAHDQELVDAEGHHAEIDAVHFPYGIPTRPSGSTNERALHQDGYVITYDSDLRTATWVAYRLTAEDVAAELERTECFRRDVRLEDDEDAAFCEDYDEPIYDRGHLVPNADMERSEAAMINTYMFSNMSPQHANFNRGIWARLEGYVRDWATAKGTIYVVTGAIFDRDGDERRDADEDAERVVPRDRVAVPSAFFKVVLHERENGFIEAMAFVLPHNNQSITGAAADPYLEAHLTSIDAIEAVTGVNFSRRPPSAKQRAVEAAVATGMWER